VKRWLLPLIVLLICTMPLAWAQVYDSTTGQQKVITTPGVAATVTSVCTKVIAVNQTSSTDLYTSTAKVHICAIMLVSAGAQGVSISEGTGSTCASGTGFLIGGASGTVALAANGGFSMAASAPFVNSLVAADHICLLQSSSGNVSGIITYVDD
jgi:hypothetical protein